MAQSFSKLDLDVTTRHYGIVTSVQKDTASRFLDISLLDNGFPIDLTGHEVKIYMKKPEPDKTVVFNNGEITNATIGRCQFELTSQALATFGHMDTQVLIFKDNVEILSTPIFDIFVEETIFDNEAIESTNEYGALVVLFKNIYDALEIMNAMVANVGTPVQKETDLGISTLHEGIGYILQWLEDNSVASVVATINAVDAKIGETDDTGGTETTGTLSAKANKIIEQTEPIETTAQTKKFTNATGGFLVSNVEVSAYGNGHVSVSAKGGASEQLEITIDGGDAILVFVGNISVYFESSIILKELTTGNISYIIQM